MQLYDKFAANYDLARRVDPAIAKRLWELVNAIRCANHRMCRRQEAHQSRMMRFLMSAHPMALSPLRVVSRIKGVSRVAEVSGLSRKGVQKALSENGNPQFSSVNAIMHAMGYRLTPQKLPAANHVS